MLLIGKWFNNILFLKEHFHACAFCFIYGFFHAHLFFTQKSASSADTGLLFAWSAGDLAAMMPPTCILGHSLEILRGDSEPSTLERQSEPMSNSHSLLLNVLRLPVGASILLYFGHKLGMELIRLSILANHCKVSVGETHHYNTSRQFPTSPPVTVISPISVVNRNGRSR